jgi:signal transduction histidine kinase
VRGELTDLIHELRPPSLNADEFDEMLNEYIIEWAHQAGIKASLTVKGTLDIPLDLKQTIYRIMQEALANAARHSSAEKVIVSIQQSEERIEIMIQDNGIGFTIQNHYDGIGLESMRERAESLGGDITITSEVGEGTKITTSFPIESVRE